MFPHPGFCQAAGHLARFIAAHGMQIPQPNEI
jgi:hypothetical protein